MRVATVHGYRSYRGRRVFQGLLEATTETARGRRVVRLGEVPDRIDLRLEIRLVQNCRFSNFRKSFQILDFLRKQADRLFVQPHRLRNLLLPMARQPHGGHGFFALLSELLVDVLQVIPDGAIRNRKHLADFVFAQSFAAVVEACTCVL